MTAAYDEPVARIGIGQILEKVTRMEQTLAVMSCDLGALRRTTAEQIGDLETRTRAMEGDRFPWKVIGGLVAVATLMLGVTVLIMTPGAAPKDPPPRRPGSTAGP